MNKYVLMTGAPGSKWSGVARSIYGSESFDHTDHTSERNYRSEGRAEAMHTGAYWDPGMEFKTYDWDGPFSGEGIRLIKSHTFAHQLDHLKDPDYGFETPSYPIIMVYRNDYECMNQWFEAGGFKITYPNYKPYYKNADNMWIQIKKQNLDIMDFIQKNRKDITRVYNNEQLADTIEISRKGLGDEFHGPIHNYHEKDILVYVYQPKTS